MNAFERFHYDEAEDRLIIEKVQDVEPILEANKRAFRDFDGYKQEVFNEKADIPEAVWTQWCQKQGISYQEFLSNPKVLRRFLNDPDNAFCLRIPGKV